MFVGRGKDCESELLNTLYRHLNLSDLISTRCCSKGSDVG